MNEWMDEWMNEWMKNLTTLNGLKSYNSAFENLSICIIASPLQHFEFNRKTLQAYYYNLHSKFARKAIFNI